MANIQFYVIILINLIAVLGLLQSFIKLIFRIPKRKIEINDQQYLMSKLNSHTKQLIIFSLILFSASQLYFRWFWTVFSLILVFLQITSLIHWNKKKSFPKDSLNLNINFDRFFGKTTYSSLLVSLVFFLFYLISSSKLIDLLTIPNLFQSIVQILMPVLIIAHLVFRTKKRFKEAKQESTLADLFNNNTEQISSFHGVRKE